MEQEDQRETKEDGKLIRVTKEADRVVLDLLHRINASVENVRMTKSAVVSFLIEHFGPQFGEAEIKALYMQTVSEVDLLRNAYKQALESGVIPENLRDILFANAGLAPGPKKAKKHRQRDGSNATNMETETV